ncbi:uncharacterized protein LOC113501952 [Trichoplusia ni]|uniref:Uncharacterized protein LOC113501952 n=1 Tax=Trichoplusia ni TaxID=7111 RepID=A0A7E5WEI9_TRINI|nr:uncharacterized protein LOC113501952 [Trichoplusia ni]
MDLKDDEKSANPRQCPHVTTSRYFESKAGHLFVKDVNPFNGPGNNVCEVKQNHKNKRKNDEFINIFQNKTPQNSTELMEEIMKNYPVNNRHVFLTDQCNDTFIQNEIRERPYSQPAINMNNLLEDPYMTSCSKDIPHSANISSNPPAKFDDFNEDDNRHEQYAANDIPAVPLTDEPGKAEKTTYCRPMMNLYNQEFVYKTMQRNARLQRLVKRLVIARESEKQREAWNNYINELKNKHRYYSNEPNTISPQYVPDEPNANELVDDFCNTRYNCRQSNPCQHLLKDIYEVQTNTPPNPYETYPRENDNIPSEYRDPYETNRYRFTTSSQANLMRWDVERQYNNFVNDWRPRPPGAPGAPGAPGRYYRGNRIVVEREYKRPEGSIDKIQATRKLRTTYCQPPFNKACKCRKRMFPTTTNSIPVQTESLESVYEEETDSKDPLALSRKESFKDKFRKVTNNIAKLKSKIRRNDDDDIKSKSLAQIEDKIDTLIQSINSIMVDIKSSNTHRRTYKTASVSCRFVSTSHNNLNRNKSAPYGMINNEEYLCEIVQSSSRNFPISECGPSSIQKKSNSSNMKMDNIIIEELRKSDRVKRDIEDLLNLRSDRNCAVHITFDIPTRETATEVTNSLSKTKLESRSKVVVEELRSDEFTEVDRDTQMTIAVNTEPLGLFALLRISTDTVKQMLSYVPNLNYNSYLSMLQVPAKRCVTHYICNICGAAFGRPSQLSDHIDQHNLGKTRDCCVCRHTLDTKKTRAGLFACRYCGQRFTRAYCCELHQQTCAKMLGRVHDVNSSHMLLR